MTGVAGLGPPIGIGKEAEVFAHGEGRVAKLYRAGRPKQTAFREAFAMGVAESLGLPCPRVWGVGAIDDRWAVVMDRVEGPTFAQALQSRPDRTPELVEIMARLHLRIHATAAAKLPRLNDRLATDLEQAELPPRLRDQLRTDLAALPSGSRLCHGDFHPMNIIGPPQAPVIIDWADATQGAPEADGCRSYVLIRSISAPLAEAYIDSYAAASGRPRTAIMAWLPIVAAARLAEGISDGEATFLRSLIEGGMRSPLPG